MGGEITISWLIPWELIYSSNVSSICLPVKCVDRLRGWDLISKGGAISLGPPLGDPILAHFTRISRIKKDRRI
jgi:hypothetical protein